MRVRQLLIPTLGAALCFSLGAFAQDAGSTAGQGGSQNTASAKKASDKSAKPSGKTGGSAMDKKFVTNAAQGGLAEVDLGNLAKSNAKDDSIKQFGDRMVTDHGKANDELKDLAQKKGWTLPSDENAADKAKKDRLAKKKGADFDKAYIRDMVADHVKDVHEFKKCAASCSDPDLKAWAGKTVSTLEDHLKMARQDAEKVGALMTPKKENKSSKSNSPKSGSSSGEKPSGAIL